MKATRKLFVIAVLALFLSGLMSSCRAGQGCGGCPTWSLEQSK